MDCLHVSCKKRPAPSSPSQSSSSSSRRLAHHFILPCCHVFLSQCLTMDLESNDPNPFTPRITAPNKPALDQKAVFSLKGIVKHPPCCFMVYFHANNKMRQNCRSRCLLPVQAQLIHDRNTASHLTSEKMAGATADRVHMTWTKDKLYQEKNKQRECLGVKDVFNMKPYVGFFSE